MTSQGAGVILTSASFLLIAATTTAISQTPTAQPQLPPPPKGFDAPRKKIENGKVGFKELEAYILEKGDIDPNESGRQEFLENLINEFI